MERKPVNNLKYKEKENGDEKQEGKKSREESEEIMEEICGERRIQKKTKEKEIIHGNNRDGTGRERGKT